MIDGLVLHNIIDELNKTLVGGRIDKINQPEKDELLIHIRSKGEKQRLSLMVTPSMPRLHLVSKNKANPPVPPAFCMLLRKYIGNARIVAIEQKGLERIVSVHAEQLNELGDLCRYQLIIEIMGKHSNIIFCDEKGKVLDSIKRIGFNISSVRQVYPGQEYILPPDQGKSELFDLTTIDIFKNALKKNDGPLYKSLYMSITGLSPFIANHLCHIIDISSDTPLASLSDVEWTSLYDKVNELRQRLLNNDYHPYMLLKNHKEAFEFHSLLLNTDSKDIDYIPFDSISQLIETFYSTRTIQLRMKQKTQDLRKLVQTALERCYKKLDLQKLQLKDTQNMDKFKIKGELILANQYLIKDGQDSIEVLNYYTNNMQKISLDPTKTAIQNANASFEKYNKKKRTQAAVIEQIQHTESEIDHLESVRYSLESIQEENDIEEIRSELMETGYLKFRRSKKKNRKSKPYHYISSDGFHIYVGKNNYQNEELSMKFANNSDWWFHAKGVPGSHVIVKAEGKELPDRVYEEAASLAAHYSKASESTKASVDYTQKKNLKKPAGSAPGYVIYHTNYSLMIEPDISNLEQVD